MPERVVPELKPLASLKDLLADGPEVQIDPTEDAWEFGAPPARGVYKLKLFLQKDGLKVGLTDAKDPTSIFIQEALECKIVSDDPEIDGMTVFGRVNTRIYRGKSISTMAGLIVKMGYKVPTSVSPKKVATLFEMAVKKEPVVEAELDWRGAYSYTDPKTGNTVWENVYNHYEEFPDEPKKPGTKQHRVSVTSKAGGVAEVRAQLQIVRFFGKGEAPSHPELVSSPKLAQVSKVAEPELVLEPTKTGPAKAAAQSDDADLQLLLATN